jgi:hypothetical protein
VPPADRPDKPDKDKHEDKGKDKDKPDKPDKDMDKDKDQDKDGKHEGKGGDGEHEKGNGTVPVPLLAGMAGWLPAIRRRLGRVAALAGAQIRGTARIRQKAKGGMSGAPRGGSERPAGTATCPSARSAAAVWWRTWFGSCAPASSTRIRHPT